MSVGPIKGAWKRKENNFEAWILSEIRQSPSDRNGGQFYLSNLLKGVLEYMVPKRRENEKTSNQICVTTSDSRISMKMINEEKKNKNLNVPTDAHTGTPQHSGGHGGINSNSITLPEQQIIMYSGNQRKCSWHRHRETPAHQQPTFFLYAAEWERVRCFRLDHFESISGLINW